MFLELKSCIEVDGGYLKDIVYKIQANSTELTVHKRGKYYILDLERTVNNK